MDRFVCVRVVQMKGVDLRRHDFDGDQTFAVLLFHADGTLLGRYGTRSAARKDSARDVSLAGFAAALEGALELHAGLPGTLASVAGKSAPRSPVRSAEEYPELAEKAKDPSTHGCLHCHNTAEGWRRRLRAEGKPLPDDLMFPWPMPDRVGLVLDPDRRATVKAVAEGSSAAKAGFLPGDAILAIEGQVPISVADVQWVLHVAPPTGTLKARVRRADGKEADLAIPLLPGWRKGDVSWRESFWPARPGFRCDPVEGEAGMALRVKFIFERQESGKAAKRAGLEVGDVIVEVDGRKDLLSETDFLVHVLQGKVAGQSMAVKVRRSGRTLDLVLPVF
jgi:serine protease Do